MREVITMFQPYTKRPYGRQVSTKSPSARMGRYTRPPRAKGNATQPRS